MEIKNETIDKVMNSKPWREVEPLIHELTGQFPVQQSASFEPAKEAPKMPEMKMRSAY